jgi:hypothetical protein
MTTLGALALAVPNPAGKSLRRSTGTAVQSVLASTEELLVAIRDRGDHMSAAGKLWAAVERWEKKQVPLSNASAAKAFVQQSEELVKDALEEIDAVARGEDDDMDDLDGFGEDDDEEDDDEDENGDGAPGKRKGPTEDEQKNAAEAARLVKLAVHVLKGVRSKCFADAETNVDDVRWQDALVDAADGLSQKIDSLTIAAHSPQDPIVLRGTARDAALSLERLVQLASGGCANKETTAWMEKAAQLVEKGLGTILERASGPSR